jgi:hypothetical protein
MLRTKIRDYESIVKKGLNFKPLKIKNTHDYNYFYEGVGANNLKTAFQTNIKILYTLSKCFKNRLKINAKLK